LSGGGASASAEAALAAYARFLSHQLGEIAVLAGATPPSAPADAVRARLEQVLADLRDLSAETSGAGDRFDLAAAAADVARRLSRPGRAVRLETGGEVPLVAGDARLLTALLGHLMRPVVATSARGVTFVLTAGADGDRVHVELADDSGAASAESTAARLRYGSPSGGAGQLLGAGVSGPAAARIVAAHGGSIEIRPEAAGTRAVFDLPAAR
jgi:signal transduction histidine kinase